MNTIYTHKKMKTDAASSLKVLKDVLPLLEKQEDYSNDALYSLLSTYVEKEGVKNGYVMWPVRTALQAIILRDGASFRPLLSGRLRPDGLPLRAPESTT